MFNKDLSSPREALKLILQVPIEWHIAELPIKACFLNFWGFWNIKDEGFFFVSFFLEHNEQFYK